MAAAEAYFRRVHEPFGPLTDAQWRRLAETSVRPDDAGGLALRYDPGIITPLLQGPIEDIDLWAIWDHITCPVLVLRGASSDILLAETAAEMAARGPKAKVVEIAGCGHAPMLNSPDQVAVVRDWLAGG